MAGEALARGHADGRAAAVPDDVSPAVLLLDRLLAGPLDDDEWPSVEAEARSLGIHPPDTLVIALLVARRGADLAAARDTAHRLAADAPERLWAGPAKHDGLPHVVLLLALGAGEAFADALGRVQEGIPDDGRLFLHALPYAVDLAQVPRAYERTRRTVEYAFIVPPRSRRLDPGILQMCRFMASAPAVERIELFETVLGPVLRHSRAAELLHILDVLVATGTLKAAREALGVSGGTLTSRCRLIAELTGYDFGESWGRHVLSQAVVCRWLAARDRAAYNERTWGPRTRVGALRAVRP